MPREKYRVHEVAKDFGLNSKKILSILDTHMPAERTHMAALEDRELDLIFETVTQENSVQLHRLMLISQQAKRKRLKKILKKKKLRLLFRKQKQKLRLTRSLPNPKVKKNSRVKRRQRARKRTESLRTISLRKTTIRISPSRISHRTTLPLRKMHPSRKSSFRQEPRAKRDMLTQEAAM